MKAFMTNDRVKCAARPEKRSARSGSVIEAAKPERLGTVISRVPRFPDTYVVRTDGQRPDEMPEWIKESELELLG